jgi:hypothetical protein
VSPRVLRFNINLKSFGPLYNDVNGEIDSEMVNHLDRNLHIGGEIKAVYKELSKTVNDTHLLFDLDSYIQKVPKKLNISSSYVSSLLKKHGQTKSINRELIQKAVNKSAPWGNIENEREWNKT